MWKGYHLPIGSYKKGVHFTVKKGLKQGKGFDFGAEYTQPRDFTEQ